MDRSGGPIKIGPLFPKIYMKKLYRSTSNRMIAGVCAGIADYVNVDTNVVRLLYIFGLMITGVFPLVILYVIAMFMIPEKGNETSTVIDGKVEDKNDDE